MRSNVALAAILALLSRRVAGYNLAVNWTISPDTPVQVAANLTPGAEANTDLYRKFAVSLAMAQECTGVVSSTECQTSGPVCILLDCVSTNVTGFMIQDGIPTSVGPTGRFYSLSYRLYDSPLTDFDVGLGYSNGWNDFTLLGTRNWTQYELEGHGMWDWNENVPCSAYDCATQCAQQLNAHSLPFGDPTMTACLKACPGYDDRQKGCITKDAFDGNTLQQTIIGTRPRYSPGSSSDAAPSSSTTSAEASPSSTNPPNSSFRVELPLLACIGPILGALLAIGR